MGHASHIWNDPQQGNIPPDWGYFMCLFWTYLPLSRKYYTFNKTNSYFRIPVSLPVMTFDPLSVFLLDNIDRYCISRRGLCILGSIVVWSGHRVFWFKNRFCSIFCDCAWESSNSIDPLVRGQRIKGYRDLALKYISSDCFGVFILYRPIDQGSVNET